MPEISSTEPSGSAFRSPMPQSRRGGHKQSIGCALIVCLTSSRACKSRNKEAEAGSETGHLSSYGDRDALLRKSFTHYPQHVSSDLNQQCLTQCHGHCVETAEVVSWFQHIIASTSGGYSVSSPHFGLQYVCSSILGLGAIVGDSPMLQ